MSLLDDAQLRELHALLGARFPEMVDRLAAQVDEALATLAEAHAAGDVAALVRVAHRLKGSAGALGARALGDAAGEVEQHAREGGEVAVALDALVALVAPTLAALRVR